MHKFEPISLRRLDEYSRALALTPQRTSDFSFVNIYGWAEVYGLQWSFDGPLAWLRQTRPETVYWAPVGPWDEIDFSRPGAFPEGATQFIRVPEQLARQWIAACSPRILENRGDWDYVYKVDDLVGLPGEAFAKKRAQLERFMEAYDYEYSPITMECVEEALEMQRAWAKWRDRESGKTLEMENRAIARVLKDWDRLDGLMGGSIRVDGEMVAYTVAEPLDRRTVVIHFEKGHTEFEGVYQAINRMFLADQGRAFEYVNREQDLDDPGLRKSKLSYNPAFFLKKYEIRF